MEIRLKNIVVSLVALVCVSAQNLHAMNASQKNILITVRYHHPTHGSTAHYFSLPPTCNVGQLQQFISQKLCTTLEDQKLFVSKSHIEAHPTDQKKDYLVEVTKVLLDPQRPLDNDNEFGIPIVKELYHGPYEASYIMGYVPPCFDLVCLSDYVYPHTLPVEWSTLFIQNIVIKKSSIYATLKAAIEKSYKTKIDTNNNDFQDI